MSTSSSYVLSANGSWTVSSGANAVRLEYYVNGTLSTVEERVGVTGDWTFSASGAYCGIAHTLEVKAWPMIIDSAGNRTTCSAALTSASQSVTRDCLWRQTGIYPCGFSCQNYYPTCPSTSPTGAVCSPFGSQCQVKKSSALNFYQCM
jgi:hypothetical protein